MWFRRHLSFTNTPSIKRRHGSRGKGVEQITKNEVYTTTLELQQEHSTGQIGEESEPVLWYSLWLSRRALGGLATIFATCAGALVAIWQINTRNDGFRLVTTNHYSWTYSPTAIIVILVAIWRQVDQTCKLLLPWQVLQKADASAKTSVLLDYISPLQIVSLWNAVRKRHWPICLTISSFILLKLITLATTGLFFTDFRIETSQTGNLFTGTSFDGSLYNATAYLSVSDSSLFYTAYAVMAKGLRNVQGTLDSTAYQTLSIPDSVLSSNATISAAVDVFVPSFNCEKTNASINLQPANTTAQHPESTLNLLAPKCKLLAGAPPIYTLNPQLYECPSRQLSGLMQRVDCSGQNSPTPIGNWQLLTLTDMRYTQTRVNGSDVGDGSEFEASSWSSGVAQISSILCRPSYTMQTHQITYDLSQNPTQISLTPQVTSQSRSLQNFEDADLGVMFTSAYMASALMFGNKADSDVAEEYPDTMFKTMAEVSGGGYEVLLDEDVMISAAEKVFNHVAVQIASKNLVRAEQSPVTGTISALRQRLYVREASLWLVVAGFSVMTVLVVMVSTNRSTGVVPRDPEPISSTAILLADSPGFEEVLCDCSAVTSAQLEKVLDRSHYASLSSVNAHGQQSFTIEVTDDGESTDSSSTDAGTPWWNPLLLRRLVMVLVLGLPPALIAVLEVLNHLSQRKTGITMLSDSGSFSTESCTRFVPALAMLLVSTSFNALDFNIAVLAPYHSLKTRDGINGSNLFRSVMGKMPPIALWVAVKQRYWSVFMSSVGALLGSLLTIIVSGLLVIDSIGTSMPATLRKLDNFNTTWANSVTNDSSAAVVVSLIEAANLSYPPFTYEELALPKLQYAEDMTASTAPDSLVDALLPALRGSLACSMLQPDQFNLSGSFNARILSASASVEATLPLPPECPYGGPGGNLSHLDFQYFFQLPSSTNQSFIGKMLDLHVGPYSGPFADSSDEVSPYTQADNPAGCPSLGFIYGYVDVEDMSKSVVSTMACSQVIERLDARVVLNANDLSISPTSVPVANESTASLLASGPDNLTSSGRTTPTAFPFRLQVHMDQALSMFNQTQYSSSSLSSQPPVDNFFQAVLFGRTPVPQELMGRADEESQNRVRQGILNFYRRYMAQAISANMRVNNGPASSPATSTGAEAAEAAQATSVAATLVNVPGAVLRVNSTSKLILQALLAAMFVCGLTAVLLNPMRKVVPHNPCTIAGVASLLAGSRLVKELSAAKSHDEAESLLRSTSVQLGWWDDVGLAETADEGDQAEIVPVRRRYGIDIVKETG
ncbi:hypothetical protein A1O3_01759 [Capronia epimyces CBS 606.96]|uniref:Transmembrane protein n=1 Tax=Capronia epimyces CBS 606.96 TaxID=1182542 RepID=W9YJW7_9EURO|nr:uncharacterized protein A1O3_01759 [Capronia epimyces CBS 606.96]EXJ93202.1 hypothetical protein A1O3_01759 [Capronia epimyces CBS 606.96]